MKKERIAALCMVGILALVGMTGCGNGEKNVEKQEQTMKNEESPDDSSEIESEGSEEQSSQETEGEPEQQDSEEEENKEGVFSIRTETYEEGDIHIKYPHVENLVNEEVTDWYNEEFKSTIETYTSEVEEGDMGASSETVNETFQVTYQSEEMISILIEGNFYAEGAAHPYSYMRSYNINLKTGETLGITDEYTPEEIVEDILAGNNYAVIADTRTMEAMTGENLEYVKQEIAAKDRDFFLECMDNCDYRFRTGTDGSITDEENMVYAYSLRLPDGTWAIGTDVSHALGDYRILRYDK